MAKYELKDGQRVRVHGTVKAGFQELPEKPSKAAKAAKPTTATADTKKTKEAD